MLRDRVLSAAASVRAPGRPLADVEDIGAVEAFRRQVVAFDAYLDTLGSGSWDVPVIHGFTVRELVAHLVAVERDVATVAVGNDPAVADVEHLQRTRPVVAEFAALALSELRSTWWEAVETTLALVEDADLSQVVTVHRLRATLGTLIVVRTFEVWTHENDIRAALGHARTAPDAAALRVMCEVAARALPLGASRTGISDPLAVRLVLTGPGGGTWDTTTTGRPVPGESAGIVADAVDFCRLAANRIGIAGLDVRAFGDGTRTPDVLAAIRALALD